MRRNVLIVNCFFDEYRRASGSPYRVPRAMGPVYLAGAFNPETTDVRLHNEQYAGPLTDTGLLGWADLLVLTGVTASFDRMLHLTAYARTLNPRVRVAAGGPSVRALPKRSRRFFDYVCLGDIEELQDVARDALGEAHVAEEMFPRYDLADRSHLLGYVEASRNCNFACAFCSLTGEKGRYRIYDVDYVRRQIEACGKKHIVFLDNNFFGSNRRAFTDRIELLRDLRRSGRIESWSALVTGDFFAKEQNLDLVRDTGCYALFSGVESFDEATLRAYNKRQNTVAPQVEMIRNCLEAGILFNYGIILDNTTRTLQELHAEIDFILAHDEITLPAFYTLVIPLLGTPYFQECVEQGRILPGVRLRDLNGISVSMRGPDPVEDTVAFARDLVSLSGYRKKVYRHAFNFHRRYWRKFTGLQHVAAAANAFLTTLPTIASSPANVRRKIDKPSYLAPTEPLDRLYQPIITVAAKYESYFQPTMVTDCRGDLAEDLIEDFPDLARTQTSAEPEEMRKTG